MLGLRSPRGKSLRLIALLVALVSGCGGIAVHETDGDSGSDANGSQSATSNGATSTGGAATTSGTGGAGGETPDGGICNAPPAPSQTLPEGSGCYVNPMGEGWVPTPCVCDLWLANTTHAPISASIELVVTPPDEIPTIEGTLDVGVAFEDPDAIWFAAWSKQAGNGQAFTVTNIAGTTTVRMGQSKVLLAPVPVPACTTRTAIAHVLGGSYLAALTMHAVLANEIASATADGLCSGPPPPQQGSPPGF